MARFRPDKCQPVGGNDFGEIGIFGEETHPGVDRIGPGYAGSGDDRGNIQIGIGAGRRSDTDRFIGKTHGHGIRVGGRMHNDIGNLHFLAGAQHPQCNIPAIRYEDFLEHYSMMTRASPNSTGCAF